MLLDRYFIEYIIYTLYSCFLTGILDSKQSILNIDLVTFDLYLSTIERY